MPRLGAVLPDGIYIVGKGDMLFDKKQRWLWSELACR
jgi:hypothetical protein